jgi:hypothetical protein
VNPGYVYVLAFDGGTVKVGRTQDTGKRLNAHKSDAGKFGLTVTDHWLSPPHTEWRENEETLKKIAASLGGTAHRKEYFSGADFAAIVDEARKLPFTEPPDTAAQTASQNARPATATVTLTGGTVAEYDPSDVEEARIARYSGPGAPMPLSVALGFGYDPSSPLVAKARKAMLADVAFEVAAKNAPLIRRLEAALGTHPEAEEILAGVRALAGQVAALSIPKEEAHAAEQAVKFAKARDAISVRQMAIDVLEGAL